MWITEEHTCEHCGKIYRKAYSQEWPNYHYYCCRACQKAATAQRHECTCQTCGASFVRSSTSRGVFCSYACYWQSLQGQKPHNYAPVTIECATCGKPFEIARGRVGKAQFCSVACMAKSRIKERITKTCPTCGKTFSVWPSQERVRYCSHTCHGKDTRGERSVAWKGGRFPYYGEDWKDVRQQVRERDGYRCQVCGIHERDLPYRLHAHHIIPRRAFHGDLKLANELVNLIALCRACHRKAEQGLVILRPKLV